MLRQYLFQKKHNMLRRNLLLMILLIFKLLMKNYSLKKIIVKSKNENSFKLHGVYR